MTPMRPAPALETLEARVAEIRAKEAALRADTEAYYRTVVADSAERARRSFQDEEAKLRRQINDSKRQMECNIEAHEATLKEARIKIDTTKQSLRAEIIEMNEKISILKRQLELTAALLREKSDAEKKATEKSEELKKNERDKHTLQVAEIEKKLLQIKDCRKLAEKKHIEEGEQGMSDYLKSILGLGGGALQHSQVPADSVNTGILSSGGVNSPPDSDTPARNGHHDMGPNGLTPQSPASESNGSFQFEGIVNPTPWNSYRAKNPRTSVWHVVLVLSAEMAAQATPLVNAPLPACLDTSLSWLPGYEEGGPLVQSRFFPILYFIDIISIPQIPSDKVVLPQHLEAFDWISASDLREIDLDDFQHQDDVDLSKAKKFQQWIAMRQKTSGVMEGQVTDFNCMFLTQPRRENTSFAGDSQEYGDNCPTAMPNQNLHQLVHHSPDSDEPRITGTANASQEISFDMGCENQHCPSASGLSTESSMAPGGPSPPSPPSTSSPVSSAQPMKTYSPSTIVVASSIPPLGSPIPSVVRKGQYLSTKRLLNEDSANFPSSPRPSKKVQQGKGSTELTVKYEQLYRNGIGKHRIFRSPATYHEAEWYIFLCANHLQHFSHQNVLAQMSLHWKQEHVSPQNPPEFLSTSQEGWDRCIQLFGVSVLDCSNEQVKENNAALDIAVRLGRISLNPRMFEPVKGILDWIQGFDQAKFVLPGGGNISTAVYYNQAQYPGAFHPKLGKIYHGPDTRFARQRSHAFLVLPFLEPFGEQGKVGFSGHISATGLLDMPHKPVPYCFRFNTRSKVIEGWADGFGDGDRRAHEREFPVMYFDDSATMRTLPLTGGVPLPVGNFYGWVAEKDFKEMDFDVDASRSIVGFAAAKRFAQWTLGLSENRGVEL